MEQDPDPISNIALRENSIVIFYKGLIKKYYLLNKAVLKEQARLEIEENKHNRYVIQNNIDAINYHQKILLMQIRYYTSILKGKSSYSEEPVNILKEIGLKISTLINTSQKNIRVRARLLQE